MYIGIALDLEGTCIDLETQHFKAYERACLDLGISLSAESISEISGARGGGREFIIGELQKKFPEKDLFSLYERKKKYFDEIISDSSYSLRDGLKELLVILKEKDIPLAIGSTTAREEGESYMAKSGLVEFIPFSQTIFREDVSSLKPSGEVYEKTAALLGIEPMRQLVFEDTIPGVLAAHAAGSDVIAVPSSFYFDKEKDALKAAGALKVIGSWRESDPSLFMQVS
jgi:beta-phosphoglucomutase-like phosphatase (HAD superfamily)